MKTEARELNVGQLERVAAGRQLRRGFGEEVKDTKCRRQGECREKRPPRVQIKSYEQIYP